MVAGDPVAAVGAIIPRRREAASSAIIAPDRRVVFMASLDSNSAAFALAHLGGSLTGVTAPPRTPG
jgi:hypothetical protein